MYESKDMNYITAAATGPTKRKLFQSLQSSTPIPKRRVDAYTSDK